MRFMTVAGSEPSRNPVIAVMISSALRPYSRDTEEAAVAPEVWQPEQDAAPGGGSEAASTGARYDRRNRDGDTQRFHLADLPIRERRPRAEAAARYCQAKVMFWSCNGTERMRLPVAAK